MRSLLSRQLNWTCLDAPEGQKPGMPINVTVDAVSGGWVIRWKNPAVMPLYYTIEKKEDSQSAEWEPLTDHKIDPEEASYLSEYQSSYQIHEILILQKLDK